MNEKLSSPLFTLCATGIAMPKPLAAAKSNSGVLDAAVRHPMKGLSKKPHQMIGGGMSTKAAGGINVTEDLGGGKRHWWCWKPFRC